jgi:hypothetical protein
VNFFRDYIFFTDDIEGEAQMWKDALTLMHFHPGKSSGKVDLTLSHRKIIATKLREHRKEVDVNSTTSQDFRENLNQV